MFFYAVLMLDGWSQSFLKKLFSDAKQEQFFLFFYFLSERVYLPRSLYFHNIYLFK